ncbi:MAG: DNA-directed RNA polymerase subunit alpha [Candidatus Moranbacteria bacterium]|nr:DNA-directed RNA polymerase subunit alpha [Candidatus Moranbacteria bacterium]
MKKIVLPQKPKYVKGDDYEATFEIKGCHPGYGNTLGNALRRVLLSSLPGYAITRVKFNRVDHEFSTIPGVKENVVQIILNIKGLRFKMHKDEPTVVKIKANGIKEVVGADIQTPSSVEVINKDAVIATLTEPKAKFEAELTIEKGIGYSSIENREIGETKKIGMIEINALFTPIKKVNYVVENMRVGKRTDFDKIIFTIQTDGSLKPEEAFKQASEILVQQFAALAQAEQAIIVKQVQAELNQAEAQMQSAEKGTQSDDIAIDQNSATNQGKKDKTLLEKSIHELSLSKRIASVLENEGIDNLAKIAAKNEKELNELEGIGEKGIREIKKAIGAYGIILDESN